MKPECTAECEKSRMLEVAIEALVEAPCPFMDGGELQDGNHVDFTDPECYANVAAATGEDYWTACRACITEALEERVQPDPTPVVALSRGGYRRAG